MIRVRIVKIALALAIAQVAVAIMAASALATPGIEKFTTAVSGTGAGVHADVTTEIKPNLRPGSLFIPDGLTRSADLHLPPGLIGNPNAVAQCNTVEALAAAVLESGSGIVRVCPAASQVGTAEIKINSFGEERDQGFAKGAVFNLQPSGDELASLVVTGGGLPPVYLHAGVRSSGDFGIDANSPEFNTDAKLVDVIVTIWGIPAAHARGGLQYNGSQMTAAIPPDPASQQRPFFSNPTSCGVALLTGLDATFFEFLPSGFPPPGFPTAVVSDSAISANSPNTNCQNVPFDPSFALQPTTHKAGEATGLDVDLNVPQNEDPAGIATSHLRDAVVTLPQGLVLNPSSADGLAACSEKQIGLLGTNFGYPNPIHFSEEEPSCPEASKIGTVEVDSPPLPGPLNGSVYLARQTENPFGSLTAIYLSLNGYGLHVKLAGEVKPDPATGQLTATFKDNPQVPFEDFKLHFKGGSRGVLSTPDTCGAFVTDTVLGPWSGNPASTPSSSFELSEAANGGACPASKAARAFSPSFQAGTLSTQAGSYTPLVARASKPSGQQELKRLDLTFPEGLLGKLAGVSRCSETAILKAEQQSSGKAEQASPSCPASSQIGTVNTTAGSGAAPLSVIGKAYLAGPYEGAPVSAVVITPAVAGPFDLGNVVVRAPINVDPTTAQLHVVSDQIPTILQGVPLQLRSVEVKVDRSGFTLNPTSCDKMSLGGQLSGSDALANVSNPFQVGGCKALAFKPKLALSLKGGTERNRYPALTATLTQPAGQANVAKVAATLPHSEFLAQNHIRTVCTRVQFAAGACPQGSIYGQAEAQTPLLNQTLTGPVYLRSSSHKLPDLVAVLKGPESLPIEIDLAGRIDSVKGGIRSSFETIPDAPVSRFVLRMQGGDKGLLVNSRDICKSTHRATVLIDGQNGKTADQSPVLSNGACPKAKKQKKRPRLRH
jgi:hypothetical protein